MIWAKHTFTLGRADYQRQYEPILYGWPAGHDRYWCGARDQGDVWFIDKPARNDLHPTMKPVALVERAIRNSSKSRDIVLDPFGGSGSTLIACEKTGRQARLVELDPKYCDVIVQRWQEWAGGTAMLEGDGRSFEEIAGRDASADAARSAADCQATWTAMPQSSQIVAHCQHELTDAAQLLMRCSTPSLAAREPPVAALARRLPAPRAVVRERHASIACRARSAAACAIA